VSKKVLCCGTDNPYIMIERARIIDDVDEDDIKTTQQQETEDLEAGPT
jgi:hypothetical protein